MDYRDSAALSTILIQSWIDLGHGALRSTHPFHTAVLATRGKNGPAIRSVVLREADVDTRRLLCFTDRRSAKVGQMARAPGVAWLFYDRHSGVQLRLDGTARVRHDDQRTRDCWKATDERHRHHYRTDQPPGRVLPSPGASVSGGGGFENFAVIECAVTAIDWLYLQPQGNLRARFIWHEGKWAGDWIAP